MAIILQAIFQASFYWTKFVALIQISLKIVSKGPIIISIGSDNDLAPNRRQAIIWTNDGLVPSIFLLVIVYPW